VRYGLMGPIAQPHYHDRGGTPLGTTRRIPDTSAEIPRSCRARPSQKFVGVARTMSADAHGLLDGTVGAGALSLPGRPQQRPAPAREGRAHGLRDLHGADTAREQSGRM